MLQQAVIFQGPLRPLDLRVRAGQHLLVTGARATGKTLLAETLAGQRRLTAGTLTYPFLSGAPGYEARRTALRLVSFMDNSRLARNPTNVHYYQQRYNAFDASGHPTARQYLAAGGFTPEQHAALLDAFGIRELLDREMIKLSSGQTRKVLLARELLRRPRILVIDNPYVGLDAGSRQVLNDLLDDLVARLDLTLVLCGHADAVPDAITHRLHLYADGSSWQGTIGDLPPERTTATVDGDALGRISDIWAESPRENTGEGVVRFTNVTIRYGDRAVLDGLDWRVRRGEKWVVSGPNGSGKSTLLSLVYADNPLAYANQVWLFGQRRGRGGSIWDIKRRIGYTSPELHTYFRQRLSARGVLLTGFSDTFTLPRTYTLEQEAMVDLLLRYFELAEVSERPFLALSAGTQRLLLFCRALVKAPPLLLLDEPFQGLDRAAVHRARKLLETVLGPRDTAVFISHFRPEVPGGSEWRVLELGRAPAVP
ncbi:ATP-binding cassette domain-containing protein [Lewinella sp. IMCC34183]|uniref:ATP-binding cassette domain-containing protein n=1 Tax=Lewinella sp. IMCC34183 TaxID=2248762 RepID=UPI00130035F2|nr:ATP-binding cassette domain-containing protein [Lewinella sp. IMCC34183]